MIEKTSQKIASIINRPSFSNCAIVANSMARAGKKLLSGKIIANGMDINNPPRMKITPSNFMPVSFETNQSNLGPVIFFDQKIMKIQTFVIHFQLLLLGVITRSLLGKTGKGFLFKSWKPKAAIVNPPMTLRGPTGKGCINGSTKIKAIRENPKWSNSARAFLIDIGFLSDSFSIFFKIGIKFW